MRERRRRPAWTKDCLVVPTVSAVALRWCHDTSLAAGGGVGFEQRRPLMHMKVKDTRLVI